MTEPQIAVVVLAAGHGTRMRSSLPKVLHQIAGRSMLGHVLDAAAALSPARSGVVIGDHAPEVGAAAREIDPEIFVCVQSPPQGTGDAVMKAGDVFADFDGVVLVLYADTPFVRVDTLAKMVAATQRENVALTVLGFRPEEPGAYGRLKQAENGDLTAIVEAKDAKPEDLKIGLVNSGVMAVNAAFLRKGLPLLTNANAKQEYYLTDLAAIAVGDGLRCSIIEADEAEVMGVNSRHELSQAEARWQARARRRAMDQGVTLIDPQTVYFSYDTVIANDVIVEPNVWFGVGVRVDTGTRIKAFSHLEDSNIGADVQIGPFARLRPGARLGKGTKVGNFVEIKKADIGENVAISHLAYIGDAHIGNGANIGAGTITCNYDGYDKHLTEIGAGAFVGSNSSLVAPIKIGDGAYVGSGSVITKNVNNDALSVARGRQRDIPGWGKKFRTAKERNAEGNNAKKSALGEKNQK